GQGRGDESWRQQPPDPHPRTAMRIDSATQRRPQSLPEISFRIPISSNTLMSRVAVGMLTPRLFAARATAMWGLMKSSSTKAGRRCFTAPRSGDDSDLRFRYGAKGEPEKQKSS